LNFPKDISQTLKFVLWPVKEHGISPKDLGSRRYVVRVRHPRRTKPSDESACPGQRHVEIIDPEKQEEAVARLRMIGAHQGGMIMGPPLMKAEQDRSIRVEDLTEVVMGGGRCRQAK
jgi:hypothetical protein